MNSKSLHALRHLAPLALLSMAAGPCQDRNIGSLDQDADVNMGVDGANPGVGGMAPASQSDAMIASGADVLVTSPKTDAGMTFACENAPPSSRVDSCSPAVAMGGPGGCRCIVGFSWDGAKCEVLTGCGCVSGCERVYADSKTCESDHASCKGPTAGTDAGAPCDPLAGNVLEYAASTQTAGWLVVIRPTTFTDYTQFRLFMGSIDGLAEQRIEKAVRYRDGGTTVIDFTVGGMAAEVIFPPPNGGMVLTSDSPRPSLTIGGATQDIRTLTPAEMPPAFQFVCL